MSEYEELKNLITGLTGTVSTLSRRIAALKAKAHKHSAAPTPPAPAPKPRPEYVIVVRGDYASKWFGTEAELLRLNPNFKTLAYRSDGSIMRRFTKRSWADIYPPERLRVK